MLARQSAADQVQEPLEAARAGSKKKRRASTRAFGTRRQAKRDSR